MLPTYMGFTHEELYTRIEFFDTYGDLLNEPEFKKIKLSLELRKLEEDKLLYSDKIYNEVEALTDRLREVKGLQLCKNMRIAKLRKELKGL